jgi:uncharacterized protein (TIGR02453 family)
VPRSSSPRLSVEAIAFLRQLARNNRREWFTPRKPQFDELVRKPMLALVAAVLDDMVDYAPNFLRAPEKCILRIYRDTRFSADKTPYKNRVPVWFAAQGMEKTSGAGFYFHLGAKNVEISAGCFMPEREQLQTIRQHLLENHAEFRRLRRSAALRRAMPEDYSASLSRAPKGFPCDHPALDLVRGTRWGIGVELPASIATSPKFVSEITHRFRLAAPLVQFLNAPLLAQAERPRQLKAFRLP